MARQVPLTIALCVAAGCGGCGSGASPGQLDDGSPPKPAIVVVDNDATEPVPDGFARLNLRVEWPPTTRSGLPRTIFADCVTVGITATGPGIFSPVTTTITRPDDTGSLVVPAGVQRLLTVEERDTADQHLATCDYTVAELLDGQTYDLTFVLLDDYEPNDNQGSAAALPTNGVALRAVLHEGEDEDDWYQLAVTGTPRSVRFSVTDLGTPDSLTHSLSIQLLDTDGTTVLEEQTTSNADPVPDMIFTHELTADGTFYVRVSPAAGAGYGTWEYRLSAEELIGLADTPWPMRGHDLSHTGRSPYVGAQTPTKKWDFAIGDWLYSSPAIGADGTVYVGGINDKVYALNPNGTKKWEFITGHWVESSPAIGADGTIYIGSCDENVYALNPDGTKKWDFATEGFVISSPAIGADGTIYIGSDDDNVYALNPDGTRKWDFTTAGNVESCPAVGADGTIYVRSDYEKVYALNPDGTRKWEFAMGIGSHGGLNSPAIGADGTIYVGSYDANVFALNPDGTEKWRSVVGFGKLGSPAIGADGTIYIGSYDGKLYALDPDGTTKWGFDTGYGGLGSPAIDADGTIYVGGWDFHALNPDGTEKWYFATDSEMESSPAIAADGTVYVGSNQAYKLYAFGP